MRMPGDCCGRRRKQLASAGLASLPAMAVAAFMPKCPLCIAACLGVFGASAAAAEHGYALAVLGAAVLGAFGWIFTRGRLV